MTSPLTLNDLSDLNIIIEKDRKERKAHIFEFPYQNVAKNKKISSLNERKIVTNRPDTSLPENKIHTSKYSFYNFVPKNLWEQFSKKANLYFLFIGIMQTFPYISITNGLPAIFLPLVFIVFGTAIKDLWEDYQRRKSDIEENLQNILIYENNNLIKSHWRNLRVGQIVKVEQDQYIPADLILLQTSETKGNCYIETKNLDGETNLKMKTLHKEISRVFKNSEFSENHLIFQYERPNSYLYTFSGLIINENSEQFGLDYSNFILRGSSLKNTQYIYGLVAYTGHETKIMLNSFRSKCKKSDLELKMGRQILYIFLIQMFLCLFCSFGYLIYFQNKKDSLPYLKISADDLENSIVFNFFIRYGNWTLIFTNFVPISLLVTLETVKILQGRSMRLDPNLSSNNQPITVQSSNLNEELGQIEYIFSDKTGTLTCNKMDFKAITIMGKSYGEIDEKLMKVSAIENNKPKINNVDFNDHNFFKQFEDEQSPEHEFIKEALFFLAICHTIIVENKKDEPIFNASSPDELALVSFARFSGVEFIGFDENNSMMVKYKEKIFNFKLLYVFEFDSIRKRQSVIIQKENGEICLYCKGADSVIENLLDKEKSSKNQVFEKTWFHLENFGRKGLRTLVFAQKNIEKVDFEIWSKKYEYAKQTTENRIEQMNNLQEEIEKNLILMGATAIEDKLQDEVPATIQAIKEAGIKVWVLTGDKIETAINIGYSCGLLDNNLNQFIINQKTELQIEEGFDKTIETIEKGNGNNNALIIHGDSLLHTVIKPFLLKKMLKIVQRCISVLCCRVTPQQKQEMVSLVKNQFKNVSTLAIGDGANDVSMITAASVGIGIAGVEGRQAARASDYSISEFKFLRRLLFYHGRECYRRNSVLVGYNFFKNMLIVLPQFLYGFYNFFSGQTLYDSVMYQLYNVFYSSVPIMVYAVNDQEYSDKILFENKLNYYAQGITKSLYNNKVFLSWFISGTCASILIIFFSLESFQNSFAKSKPYNIDLWGIGNMIYCLCVIISNLKILIFSNTHSIYSIFIIKLSISSYIISLFIIENWFDTETGLPNVLWYINFHLGNIIIVLCFVVIDYGLISYKRFKERTLLNCHKQEIIQMKEKLKSYEKESEMIIDNTNFLKIDLNEKNVPEIVIKIPSESSINKSMKRNSYSCLEKNGSIFLRRGEPKVSFHAYSPFHNMNISNNKTTKGEIISNGEVIHLGFAFSQDSNFDVAMQENRKMEL